MHKEHVHVRRDDIRTITIAAERTLDFRASRVVTAEVAVQFHVVLLAVHDNSVCLVMAQHQLAYIHAVAEAAVKQAGKHAALAAVVAIVFFKGSRVHLDEKKKERGSLNLIRIVLKISLQFRKVTRYIFLFVLTRNHSLGNHLYSSILTRVSSG